MREQSQEVKRIVSLESREWANQRMYSPLQEPGIDPSQEAEERDASLIRTHLLAPPTKN